MNSEKHLHIITHDVPWPASHGGLVDLYYKIKSLHQAGIKIHLHCFTLGREGGIELHQYCSSVNYYKRRKSATRLSFRLPFIVSSRIDSKLLEHLQKDNHPILMEGIHCTYNLYANQLPGRKVIVRLHNTEFIYYRQLAKYELNPLKKLYFFFESRLLKKYEKIIAEKATLLTVSKQDLTNYQTYFNASDVHFLPVFIPNTEVNGKQGLGCFCLYHGNLSISENEKAVTWLLENVFNDLAIPFVVAGMGPSKKLLELTHRHSHSCLVADPSPKEMQDLVGKAQVNILPSFNQTGVKLKLLNAFFNGKHCLVNAAGSVGSGLEENCIMATDAASFQTAIKELYQLPFTVEDILKRSELLAGLYNNERNAQQLIKWLY